VRGQKESTGGSMSGAEMLLAALARLSEAPRRAAGAGLRRGRRPGRDGDGPGRAIRLTDTDYLIVDLA
jgi:hypothetical protein